jgi:hypothetical protein
MLDQDAERDTAPHARPHRGRLVAT